MARALVIDQSSTTVGYAVVEEDPACVISFGVTGRLIQHGRIKLSKGQGLIGRILILKRDLEQLIQLYRPDELVCEDTRFLKQRSGGTSHAMAAVLAACQEVALLAGLKCYTQNPSTIKKVFTGNGRADKAAMKAETLIKWGLKPHQIKDDNHADALAAAYVLLLRGDDVREAQKG